MMTSLDVRFDAGHARLRFPLHFNRLLTCREQDKAFCTDSPVGGTVSRDFVPCVVYFGIYVL